MLLGLLIAASAEAAPLEAPARSLKSSTATQADNKPLARAFDSEMLGVLNGIRLYGLEGRRALSLKPDFGRGPMAALSLRF